MMIYQFRDFGTARQRLAKALFDVGAVLTRESDHPLVVERDSPSGKERGFRLKLHEREPNAPLSPIYLNLRTPDNPKPGPLTPEVVELAANCFHLLDFQRDLVFDAVTGLPNAGTPFAEAYVRLGVQCGLSLGRQRLFKLDKEESEGKRRIVLSSGSDGDALPDGSTILLMDDLVTEADSKLEAAQAIEGSGRGLRVKDVIVLVDRQQGGLQELWEHGYTLHSVFKIVELLNLATSIGCMSQVLEQEIRQYLKLAD